MKYFPLFAQQIVQDIIKRLNALAPEQTAEIRCTPLMGAVICDQLGISEGRINTVGRVEFNKDSDGVWVNEYDSDQLSNSIITTQLTIDQRKELYDGMFVQTFRPYMVYSDGEVVDYEAITNATINTFLN